MIKTINLVKKFDKLIAVNKLNLEIGTSEIFGFLGPNGAGKTTTIKMLVGLLKPTEGTAIAAGFDIQKDPMEAKKLLGYIPDQPFLYPKLTGEEFMRFVARLYGVKDPEKKISSLLDTFELAEYREEMIESYSHGMCQKLVMSACLLHDPQVIFVDEPMVGLDPKSIRLVKDIFRNYAKSGMTIFMSTHTLDLAQDICTRIGIINRGNLIALGTTKEIISMGKTGELEDVFLQLTKPDNQ